MAAPPSAPSPAATFCALSHRLRQLLDDHFASRADLPKLSSLSAQLDRECRDLEEDLRSLLEVKLPSAASCWLTRSDEARRILRQADGFVPSLLPGWTP
ncbi:hypothetical protein Cni_G04634 [Canna indica]|uniref:Uncharacterized protein n=1 Tax=Canna indica TaxID=4628 RepID=A0AAQ3JVS0_9LILI|nr:hypothetical protein Cni_G04634 [Canna indica]